MSLVSILDHVIFWCVENDQRDSIKKKDQRHNTKKVTESSAHPSLLGERWLLSLFLVVLLLCLCLYQGCLFVVIGSDLTSCDFVDYFYITEHYQRGKIKTEDKRQGLTSQVLMQFP